jgi:hypothetical protein
MKKNRPKTWFIAAGIALVLITSIALYLRPGKPKASTVRIQVSRIAEDGNTVRWRWTITGDHNWDGIKDTASPAGDDTVVKTERIPPGAEQNPYLSNVLHCELTVKRAKVISPGRTTYTRDLDYYSPKPVRTAVKSHITFFNATRPANKLVKVSVTKEMTLKLPAKLTLASVADSPISIQLNP